MNQDNHQPQRSIDLGLMFLRSHSLDLVYRTPRSREFDVSMQLESDIYFMQFEALEIIMLPSWTADCRAYRPVPPRNKWIVFVVSSQFDVYAALFAL